MKRLALLAAWLMLTGCSHVAYYAQAINGQLEVSRSATPIAEVLTDPATDARLRQKLQLVQQARVFATQELGLPANGTFQNYANLHRPFVVWNVFAAPEFSTVPQQWCFPIAGCVAYRGYFSEAAAQDAAATLRADGLDVFVAGIPVYSTLGWFDDPVLNTFIAYPEAELVGILFHELAHQVVYLPGDTVFNESFASTVEDEGVRRWLARANNAGAYAAYREAHERKRAFMALLARTRDRLAAEYARDVPSETRKRAKVAILEQATQEYAALKQAWGGYAGYDQWFTDTPLNNAKLASTTLYTDRVPAFSALLAQASGNLPQFYQEVAALTQLSPIAREARLTAAQGYQLAASLPLTTDAP